MLVIGEPTPRPEIPIEGTEMVIPLIAIGIFFLLMFGLFAWFFYFMHRTDAKSRIRQERLYKSPFLKRMAQFYAARPDSLFPKTYGSENWKSWLKK